MECGAAGTKRARHDDADSDGDSDGSSCDAPPPCARAKAEHDREVDDALPTPQTPRTDDSVDAPPHQGLYDDAVRARLRAIVAAQAAAARERALERARQLCPAGFDAHGVWVGVAPQLLPLQETARGAAPADKE